MLFNNPNNEQLFNDFYKNYMHVIDGIYKDVNQRFFMTDVYTDTGSFIGFSNDDKRRLYNPQNSDTPFQCLNNFMGHTEIMRHKACCDAGRFSPEEQYALIAHEIGHFIAAIERIQVYGFDEEVFADTIAVKIGLRNEIVSAIQKLIKSPMTDKTVIPELNARLNRL